MSNKMFMRVEDVAEEMGVSVSYACYAQKRCKGCNQ